MSHPVSGRVLGAFSAAYPSSLRSTLFDAVSPVVGPCSMLPTSLSTRHYHSCHILDSVRLHHFGVARLRPDTWGSDVWRGLIRARSGIVTYSSTLSSNLFDKRRNTYFGVIMDVSVSLPTCLHVCLFLRCAYRAVCA